MRSKRVLIPVGVALVLSGVALAAWLIYAGVNGSGSGTFQAGETQSAVTVTVTGSAPLVRGASTTLAATATNNDPAATHQITALTGTFTTSPSQCAQYLSIGNNSVGDPIAPGATINGGLAIVLDPATPDVCSGATWSVAFGGTTS